MQMAWRDEMTFLVSVLLIAFLAAVAKMVLLHKLGMFRRLLALDAGLDMIGGMLFAWLFMGTLTGMAIATMAGLMFSLMLLIYKRVYGYEKFSLLRWRWETVPPRWRFQRA